MAKREKLKTIHIDVEKGIYEVNGRDVSKSGKELNISFQNGCWSMVLTEDTIYTTNVQNS